MPKFIVHNFQSIKEAKLDVSGFTIITGASSAGKSALFRSIHSAFTNRFRSGCVRQGSASADISALLDSSPIKFVKPLQGSASIQFNSASYSKLNRSLPSEVESFLNVSPISSGDTSYSLNFHPQFEKPLLLEFSQRKVLELLSSSQALSDLNLVKESLSSLRAENRGAFRSVDSVLSSLKLQSSSLQSQISSLSPLFSQMALLYSSLQSLSSSLQSLSSLKELLSNSLSSRIERLSSLVSLLQNPPLSPSLPQSLSVLLQTSYPISSYKSIISSLQSLSSLSSSLQSLSSLSSILSNQSFQSSRIVELNDVVHNHICPICKSHMNHE